MRRRVREDVGAWPPEHLRHFRASDWPGKQPPEDRPLAVDCAVCAFCDERERWREERSETHPGALDPLACCPDWPDCGFTYPEDFFHPELI